jgi:hypothetical protein
MGPCIVNNLFFAIKEYPPAGLTGLQYNNNSKWGASYYPCVRILYTTLS